MSRKKTFAAAYQVPKQGNTYCGDSYFFEETEDQFICVLADGLGSGEFAQESSQIAVEAAKKHINSDIRTLLRQCNRALEGKRGVVLGLLKLDFTAQKSTFSSVGNIGVVTISSTGKKKT